LLLKVAASSFSLWNSGPKFQNRAGLQGAHPVQGVHGPGRPQLAEHRPRAVPRQVRAPPHRLYEGHPTGPKGVLCQRCKTEVSTPKKNKPEFNSLKFSYNESGALTAGLHIKLAPEGPVATDWQPITTMFKVCNAIMYDELNSNLLFIQDLHMASGALVRWSEHDVLCRYRLRANIKKDGSSRPTLQVEALMLSTPGQLSRSPRSN
jgi:hypothetical protein